MRFLWLWWLTCLAGQAMGDGMFMAPKIGDRVAGRVGVASTEQKGVVIELPEGRQAALFQTTYHGPADRFAWVIPVPGLPGKDDVFLASPPFMDELFGHTMPQVFTQITDPRDSVIWGSGFARAIDEPEPMPPPDMMGPGPDGTVVVHERMEVGEFDVAILSATGVEVLLDWLNDNDFSVPEDSGDMIGHYVDKAWHFVALRILPSEARERPVLEDVSPIGIRFPTEELVYPLYISRASSRQKTALLVVALTRGPVECEQLREVQLPLGVRHPSGASYATIRQEALEGQGPATVCEYRGPDGMPFVDLHYEKDEWFSEVTRWSPARMWATRYWALLDLEDLQDLVFTPSEDVSASRLVVLRRAVVYRPPLERVFNSTHGLAWLHALAGGLLLPLALWLSGRWRLSAGSTVCFAVVLGMFALVVLVLGVPGLLLLLIPLLLIVVWNERSAQAVTPEEASHPTWRELAHTALVGAGLGGVGFLAAGAVMAGVREFMRRDALGVQLAGLWRGEEPAWLAAAFVMGALVWIVAVGLWVRDGLRGVRWRGDQVWAFWGLLALPVILFLPEFLERQMSAWHDLEPSPLSAFAGLVGVRAGALALAALVLLGWFTVAGPFTGEAASRRAQSVVWAAIGLALFTSVTTFVGVAAHGGSLGGHLHSGLRGLDTALESIDDKLSAFAEAHGCYPARLKDLQAQQAPAAGVDSSGNPVPLDAANHRPSGAELPVDPLTGRNDTWVYEPTATPMVDSGGYTLQLRERPWSESEITAWHTRVPHVTDHRRLYRDERPEQAPGSEQGSRGNHDSVPRSSSGGAT